MPWISPKNFPYRALLVEDQPLALLAGSPLARLIAGEGDEVEDLVAGGALSHPLHLEGLAVQVTQAHAGRHQGVGEAEEEQDHCHHHHHACYCCYSLLVSVIDRRPSNHRPAPSAVLL